MHFLKKFSWRVKFALDGLRYYPRSFLDSDFWKIVLRSSNSYDSLPFSPQKIYKPFVEKLVALFFRKEGFFEFPIDYYGKKFTLRLFSKEEMHGDVSGQFLELLFPYMVGEAKKKILQEATEISRWSFPGMFWEINRSQFHSLYFFPKVRHLFWSHEGEYDNEKTYLRSGDGVFDIGACMGVFSCLAGLATGEEGRVYAFEPLKEWASLLRMNIALNNLHNVTVVEEALGDSPGTVRMEGITIVDGAGDIPVTTIDTFVREKGIERIDFLKMDVEGFERKVLLGGKESLSRFQPRMGICIYHLPDDPEVLRRIILDINPHYRIERNSTGKKFLVY